MSRLSGWPAAVLALLVVAAAGCTEGGPTQPEPQYSTETSEDSVDVTKVAVYRSGPSTAASVSGWIGPEGGSLRLQDFEVEVPAGAVTVPTKFRIKLPGDPRKLNRALAEFQPHGVTFLQPVTLRLPYRGTTAEGQTPSVIWWDGTSWIRYGTTLRADGRVETTTTHFSFFATELFDTAGITPVGG